MIRPVDIPVGQGFGENPTGLLPPDHWIIKQFGNYQKDGHAGQDYPCDTGTPIRAVTSGTVLHVGFYSGAYYDNPYWIAPNFAGYCYVIDHGAFIGIYAHGMDNGARVSVGQPVTEGQVIGLSGNTGGSTGPHLHFEILPDKFIVNSRMYGRIDPETLFAGVSAQGTITPIAADQPEEWDEMATQEQVREANVQAVWDVLEGPRGQKAIAKVVEGVLRNSRLGAGNRNLFDQGNHSIFLLNAISAKVGNGEGITAADIAAAIPAELATQVADELGKRLNGGK